MRKEKGITLIALIITIIIMLILAGVVINLTIGENGLFKIAKQAGKDYEISQTQEKLEIEKVSLLTQMNGDIPSLEEYIKYLINQNIVTTTDVTDMDDNTKEVVVNEYRFVISKEANGDIKIMYSDEIKENKPAIEEIGTTHIEKQIEYSWKELEKIAKVISDNYGDNEGQINEDTVELTVSANEKKYKLGIGDWTTVDGNKVRIIGFNYDNLANTNAYGGVNSKAGISFEYVDSLEYTYMNGVYSGGWEKSNARQILNTNPDAIINNLENKEQIKQVIKKYIATYDDPNSVKTSKDYLWLLSCSEIWDNGYKGGDTRGIAITKESEQQYLYYKINLGNTKYDSESDVTIKRRENRWFCCLVDSFSRS